MSVDNPMTQCGHISWYTGSLYVSKIANPSPSCVSSVVTKGQSVHVLLNSFPEELLQAS